MHCTQRLKRVGNVSFFEELAFFLWIHEGLRSLWVERRPVTRQAGMIYVCTAEFHHSSYGWFICIVLSTRHFLLYCVACWGAGDSQLIHWRFFCFLLKKLSFAWFSVYFSFLTPERALCNREKISSLAAAVWDFFFSEFSPHTSSRWQ